MNTLEKIRQNLGAPVREKKTQACEVATPNGFMVA
jgi:hypothetical protein